MSKLLNSNVQNPKYFLFDINIKIKHQPASSFKYYWHDWLLTQFYRLVEQERDCTTCVKMMEMSRRIQEQDTYNTLFNRRQPTPQHASASNQICLNDTDIHLCLFFLLSSIDICWKRKCKFYMHCKVCCPSKNYIFINTLIHHTFLELSRNVTCLTMWPNNCIWSHNWITESNGSNFCFKI